MSKFNQKRSKVTGLSPIVTGRVPSGRTHEGAPGYARSAKGELFLLAVSNLSGEDTFYEKAANRDDRYTGLVQEVAVADPQWTAAFLGWLRNLRGFDEAGVTDKVAASVANRLSNPDAVARSRQLPFRFLAAHEQARSLRWGHALDKALQASLANLPELPGRTLILVDTSASMTQRAFSARSKMTPAKAAAVFGIALAAKGERVDLHGFATGVFRHGVPKRASVLKEVERFLARIGEVGHGTQIEDSVRATYRGQDRVVIISDMQTMNGAYGRGVSAAVPVHVPIYGFNLGGYKHAAYATGSSNRHEFGGLTDATFRMIPLLEAGRNAEWSTIFAM
jgi:hypothetical protein